MNILIAGLSGYLGGRIKEYFSKKKIRVFDYKKKIPSKVDFIINVAGPDQDYCKKNPSLSISKRLKINKDLEKIIKKKTLKNISTYQLYMFIKKKN